MNRVFSLNSQTWKKGPNPLVRVKGPVKPFQKRKVNWDLKTSKLPHYSQV